MRRDLREGLRLGCALVAVSCLSAWAFAANVEVPDGADDAEGQLYLQELANAWGPEDPATLEKFLDVRRGFDEVFRKYERAAQQWALREASTRPLMPMQMMSIGLLRKGLDESLKANEMTFSEFRRLSFLVYGRWLRAVREKKPPEVDVLRVLREMEVGLERRLANNPPEDVSEVELLESKLARVKHHAYFLRNFAVTDKKSVLDRIDPDTRQWLERNRAEIEQYDYRYWDTVPPARAE